MSEKLLELMFAEQQKQEVKHILDCNQATGQYGLALSEEDAALLLTGRTASLREHRRFEFSDSILSSLVFTFCDSPYLNQDNYRDTLIELQELFFIFRNECMDLLTDGELLTFMKEQFDGVCFGSLEYLSGTCFERFSKAVRGGFSDYMRTGGKNSYRDLSEEIRWDKQLFFEIWNELIQ